MTRFLAALFVFLLLATPTLAEGTLEEAIAAYDAGDYEKAYALFLPLAEAGDAEAQYWVGELFVFGHGVQESQADALPWLEAAAAQDHAEAAYVLALIFSNGNIELRNDSLALEYLYQASRLCHADAAATLGMELMTLDRNPETKVEAFAWLYISIDLGGDRGLKPLGASIIAYGQDLADRGKEREKILIASPPCYRPDSKAD